MIRFALALLALAALATSGWAQSPSTAPSPDTLARVAAGVRAARGGDPARAVELLSAAAAERGLIGDYALLFLARAQSQTGADADATASYETMVRLYPTSVVAGAAAFELGQLRRKAGDCGQATALFALARERTKSPSVAAPATLEMARCLIQLERASEARRYLLELRDTWPLDPADREARATLAALDEARPELKPRPALETASAEAKRLAKEGEVTAAIALLRDVLRGHDDSPSALDVELELAGLLKRAGRPTEREASLRSIVARSPRSRAGLLAAMTLAQHLWNRGQNRETIAVLDALERREPPAGMHDEILYMRARIREEARDWPAATALYQRLVKQYPSSDRASDALWRWTWIAYRHDPPAKKLATFEQTRALARAPEVERRIRYWHARALASAGHRERAQQILGSIEREDRNGYYGRLASLGIGGERPDPTPLTGSDQPLWAALSPVAAVDALALGSPPLTAGAAAEQLERARLLSDAMLDDLALAELRAAEGSPGLDDATRVWMARFYTSMGATNRALKAVQKARSGGLDGDALEALGSSPLERFLFPLPYPYHLRRLATANRLDPLLVAALIRNESLFDPRAHSPADARGLMQIIPPTAERLARELGMNDFELGDLFQPRVNLTLGCHYLASLLARYHGDLERAVASYNAGEDAVDRWTARDPTLIGSAFAETIPYSETRSYVRNVVRDWLNYRDVYLGAR